MPRRLAVLILMTAAQAAPGQPSENDFYRLVTLPTPDDVVMEVGGLAWQDDAKTKLMACTRRGEVWLVGNPYAGKPGLPGKATSENVVTYKRMLFGLHEPLGMIRKPDGVYVAQRAELTRLRDVDSDGRFDEVKTVCDDWEISGSYHEYAFGPKIGKDGQMWVTLNRPFGKGQEADAYWRGWAVKVDPKTGKMSPVCPGLRSPAGLGTNLEGDMFYTDNQGDWVAVCKLSHLQYGKFQGNPLSLNSIDHPKSTMKNPGRGFPKNGLLWPDAVNAMPQLVAPAVWFPYPLMGKSHSDIQADGTGGKFGPFAGQLFVGDQGNAIIVRCFLEKVGGEYQGACFPFRRGFDSGVLRMEWGKDGSMFVGGTNRGWGGGPKPYCLQRLVWTGKVPFEIHEMRATPDGFELTFTKPVDPKTASDPDSYRARQWTYRYHSNYGDKPRETRSIKVARVTVAPDGKSVRVRLDGLRPYYVHELMLPGVRSADGGKMLHPVGYYTLNRIPKS